MLKKCVIPREHNKEDNTYNASLYIFWGENTFKALLFYRLRINICMIFEAIAMQWVEVGISRDWMDMHRWANVDCRYCIAINGDSVDKC
jgi:hypothetical protein